MDGKCSLIDWLDECEQILNDFRIENIMLVMEIFKLVKN